jgi:hypothetical protein
MTEGRIYANAKPPRYSRGVGAQGDILPTFVTPTSVKALQTNLAADYEVVRSALQRCADAQTFKPDDPQWLAFQGVKARVVAYLAETPSWVTTRDQMNRGELLQREVATWHDKAKAMGCDAGAAPVLPPESSMPSFFGGVGTGGLAVLALLFLLRK